MENNKSEKVDESSPLAWFNKGFSLLMICVGVPSATMASAWEFYKWNSHRGDVLKAIFPGMVAVILIASIYHRRKDLFPHGMPRWRRIFLPASGVALGTVLLFMGWAVGENAERRNVFDAPEATIKDAQKMLTERFLVNTPGSATVLCRFDETTNALRPIHILHGKGDDISKLQETSLFHATSHPVQKKKPEAAIVWGPMQEGKPGSAGVWYIYDGFLSHEVNGQPVRVNLVTLLAAQSELQSQK